MHAIIDYDIISYSCGFAVEKTYWDIYIEDDGVPFLVASYPKKRDALAWINGEEGYSIVKRVEAEPVENALQAVKYKINSILRAVKADTYMGYLTGDNNFREDIAVTKPYKGNRDRTLKPVHYDAIKFYLVNHHNGVYVDNMEADDAMGIDQYVSKNSTIICSIDKDLDQITGWHYNWNKDKIYFIDEYAGIFNFYYQLLMGDTVDNIQGVKGIGPKTALKLLAPCTSELDMYTVCRKAYNDDTKLREMADLLYIKRKGVTDRWIPPLEQVLSDEDIKSSKRCC